MEMVPTAAAAQVQTANRFMAAGNGRWAGERFIRALKQGRPISPSELRTNELLSRDEWKFFDDQIVEEAQIRLRGVADLLSAGLVRRIPNGLAKTVLEYQKLGDMNAAITSLDGVTRDENDVAEYSTAGIPLPITHKDFYINLRTLLASRTSGEGLDSTYVRLAGRKVAEATEYMLFNGGRTFAGLPIYGYLTHPNINTGSFAGAISWNNASKTGAQMVTDVATMITAMETDRFSGPYQIYVPSGASLKLQEDFKTESDKTIKQRILDMDNVRGITVVDQLPADKVVMVNMSSDVVQMVEGEPLQTVQWDVYGGFQINFKVFTIMVPLIKSDTEGRSGVVVLSL